MALAGQHRGNYARRSWFAARLAPRCPMAALTCPVCSSPVEVPAGTSERTVKCRKCKEVIAVPPPPPEAAPLPPMPPPVDRPAAASRVPMVLLIAIPVTLLLITCCGFVSVGGYVGYKLHAARELKQQKDRSANNLREIGLAMHNYHDAYKRFPQQALTAKNGTAPLLSWRVALLPFVGQEGLWREFHLDEPWDSPHNKSLISRMPKVYAAPAGLGTKDPTLTHYQVFNGPGALFEGTKQRRASHVTDGTSNTIMVIEAEQAVPWTKPEDLPFDLKGPLPRLGGLFEDGFHVAMADGSVRFLRKGTEYTSEPNLRALVTYNGGETLMAEDR